MINVVGVRFRSAGKVYYFDPGDIELSDGDKVIVETVRGLECGEVVGEPRPVSEEEVAQPLKKAIRKATPEDEAAVEENQEKERRAFKTGLEKITAHGLPMKLVDVEYTFDGSKIIFFFTADGRVDFRELVKDLAGVFRTRIELRQIGVRDEAKMIGGLGPCGRPLCCATFLRDFEPVSIRMAKDQNLSLNPTKISGICGRLMCCLKYEHDVYRDLRQGLPTVGSEIETETGAGKITELDVLRGVATVKMQDGKTARVDVRRRNGSCKYCAIAAPSRWASSCDAGTALGPENGGRPDEADPGDNGSLQNGPAVAESESAAGRENHENGARTVDEPEKGGSAPPSAPAGKRPAAGAVAGNERRDRAPNTRRRRRRGRQNARPGQPSTGGDTGRANQQPSESVRLGRRGRPGPAGQSRRPGGPSDARQPGQSNQCGQSGQPAERRQAGRRRRKAARPRMGAATSPDAGAATAGDQGDQGDRRAGTGR